MMNYCYNRLHILPGVNILTGISDVYHISYFPAAAAAPAPAAGTSTGGSSTEDPR